MKTTIFLLLTALCLVSRAQSQRQVQIGRVSYLGNGCPAGTASPVVSPDQSQFQMLWDEFTADNTRDQNLAKDVRTCNIAIQILVPQGYQLAIATDVNGFVEARDSAKAQFSQETIFSGHRFPVLTKTFGRVSTLFQTSSDENLGTRIYWSKCGEDAVARINFKLSTEGNTPALINLDHMNLRYRLKRCN